MFWCFAHGAFSGAHCGQCLIDPPVRQKIVVTDGGTSNTPPVPPVATADKPNRRCCGRLREAILKGYVVEVDGKLVIYERNGPAILRCPFCGTVQP